MTAAFLLRRGTSRLALASRAGVETPRLDAEVLLRAALGWSRERLLLHLGDTLESAIADAVDRMVERRATGEPVAYITGNKEFYGLDLRVDRRVLIPRPETELLVEIAARSLPAGSVVVDVGTGSGAIALALAHQRSDLRVVGTDLSVEALAVARANIDAHAMSHRIALVSCDLVSTLGISFDAVTANLPYVSTVELDRLPLTVRAFEPRTALDGGSDGLDEYRRLFDQLRRYHSAVGWIWCEVGDGQAAVLTDEARLRWPDAATRSFPDLAGIPRVVQIVIPATLQRGRM